jgi:hypothetical protein
MYWIATGTGVIMANWPVRFWRYWTDHSREVISPGAALWLTILSVLLFSASQESGTTADDAKRASENATTAIVRVDAVAKQSRRVAAESRAALCSFVTDLKGRVEDQKRTIARTEKYLREYPNGIPGVPIALLRQGLQNNRNTLRNQRATVRSFTDLKCPRT